MSPVTPPVGTRPGSDRDQVAPQVTGEVADEVAGEVAALLQALNNSLLSRKQIQDALGLKGQANFRERYLDPALADGLIEMTQPDSPKSPTQKYRLTEKSRDLFDGDEREGGTE